MGSMTHGVTSRRWSRVLFLRDPPTRLHQDDQRLAHLPFSVPALLPIGGTGMFARRPSASPVGYTLGTD